MKKVRNDIYISVDIETDGPAPGLHSMLSFGAAAFDIDRKLLGTFERNLELLPEAIQHPATMNDFWKRFPEMYELTRKNVVDPTTAMSDFRSWCNGFRTIGNPVFMAYPSRFDMRFIDYYSHRFLDDNLLGLGAIDIKTYASAILKKPFHQSTKRNMPKSWFSSETKHTHEAIADAIEQGELGINMIRQGLGLPYIPKP